MAEWVRESAQYSWLQKLAMQALSWGPLPAHVAIIMDGNRRFARSKSMELVKGHEKGFEKLSEVLEWCRDLHICEVTVYAFSIENFKRSDKEVHGLMELMTEKLKKLLEERELLSKHGVCIRILGCLDLLPPDVRRLAAQACLETIENHKLQLNIALAYTSREEITSAAELTAKGCEKDILHPEDINEDLLERCLYTQDSPPVDLLVRTSGEQRLSDFMLWQTGFSVMSFVKTNWPEFSLWHLLGAVFHYQCQYAATTSGRFIYQRSIVKRETAESDLRRENFLKWVQDERVKQLVKWTQTDA